MYIIILNYNGWKDTIECLESVFRNNYSNYQVIICDNFSNDHSLEKIKEWAEGRSIGECFSDERMKEFTVPYINKPISYIEYNRKQAESGGYQGDAKTNLILIQNGNNLGFSGGNNVGVRYALKKQDFSYIWFLNNDTVVDKNALEELIRSCDDPSEKIGIVGSVLCYYDNPKLVQCIGGYLNTYDFKTPAIGKDASLETIDVSVKLDLLVGASFLWHKNFLDNIGLLDESYFLYYEEITMAMQAKLNGWKIRCAKSSLVYHKGGGSTKKISSYIPEYHSVRSKIIFVKRYYKYRIPFVISVSLFQIIKHICQFRYKNAKAILDGIIDGLIYVNHNQKEGQ